ncbi:MAG: glutamine--tRNA ligase, partial [Anaeroplasmataceae bacterium]
ENEDLGSRKIGFGKNLYIEKSDFLEDKPNKKWKRLSKGIEVRLMHAYFITCNEVIKDSNGEIIELHCTYDPKTKSGTGFDERKPNGNIHFVEATTSIPSEFRLFEPLVFDQTEDTKELDFMERLNPDSIKVCNGFSESYLIETKTYDKFQFIRNGYFTTDKDSNKNKLVFNRTCELKSSF